ncbi:MAG: HAD-IC family P-type ATPase, partial [Streptococcaceae bacterium]|nr:HAD-IC family P-type ATPase [Streptococcaceae bacterium]
QYFGHLIICDEVKTDAKQTITELKKLGIKKSIMLTGDHEKVGKKIAEELGIDEVHSELLPQDKVNELENILAKKSAKGKVLFAGDGMNDTPVLALADIGIAMGGLGSDAAIEAADIVIMNDEPRKIISAMQIAKKTRKIVLQNIILALGVKAVFLILGAFGVATMWEAVISDVGVTLLAVLNALRILNTKNTFKNIP